MQNAIEVAQKISEMRQGEICRYVEWEPIPSCQWSLPYGDFQETKEEPTERDFFLPHLLQGSDYLGSCVERSNHRVFLERFGEIEGVYNLRGGWNTYGVAISLKVTDPDLWKCLDALAEYPLICEEDHSELVEELKSESWKLWVAEDYWESLAKQFSEGNVPNKDTLRPVFERVAAREGIEWIDEGGGNLFIDVSEVAKKTTLEDLKGEESCTS